MNLATLLEGPAVIFYKGFSFESKGGITANPANTSFKIQTDRYGALDSRSQDTAVEINIPPIGVWTQEVLPILYPWTNPRHAQLITPIWEFEALNIGADTITITGHGIRPSMPCRLGSFGELPAGLSVATLYYVGVVDQDTITLHLTAAAAIAATGKVDITSAGSGEHRLIEQEPLVVHTELGRRIEFAVGAVTDMPEISFSAKSTLLGGMKFECYRKNNAPWSEVNSLYTLTKAPLVVVPPNKATIPTQEYAFSWGAVAPWANFTTRGAFKVKPTLQLGEVGSDQRGLLSRKILGVTVTGTGQPNGISEAALLDTLDLQGGTTGVGKSRTAANLTITGAGVYCRLNNASVQTAPMNFSNEAPRAGDLQWETSRAIVDNALAPAFGVGTAAP